MIFTERNGTRYRPTDIRYPASSLSVSEKPAENFRSRHHRKRRFIPKRPSTAVFCTPLSPVYRHGFFHLFWYRNNKDSSKAKRTVKLLVISLCLTGLALICQLPIQTKENAGGAWSAAFQPDYVKETLLKTAGGYVWMIQISLFILLALSMIPLLKKKAFRSFAYWTAPLLFFFASLLAKAFAGHAAVIDEKRSASQWTFSIYRPRLYGWAVSPRLCCFFHQSGENPIKPSLGKRSDGFLLGRSPLSACCYFQVC